MVSKWVHTAPGKRKPNKYMTTQIKRIVVLLFVAAFLALVNTGCNTAKGFGKDVERTGETIQGD